MERSTNYILVFATAVCLVCSIFVSGAAVALKDRQDLNKKIDMQKKVLLVAGVIGANDGVQDSEIPGLFETSIEAKVVNLKTGQVSKTDPTTYDQLKASKEPATSIAVDSAAATAAGVA